MKFQIYRFLGYRTCYKEMLETYPALTNYNSEMDGSGNSYVTITSIEQLKQLVKEIAKQIILSSYDDSIKIYDKYRE